MALLSPNKWKHRKQFRWRLTGKAARWNRVVFGTYGMKAVTWWYLTNRQLESARKVIVRVTRKVWKIRLRVFPDLPYTKKGLEMPMGKGKGDVSTYRARVLPWKMVFEISGVDRETAEAVLKMASYKLPIQTKVIGKGEIK